MKILLSAFHCDPTAGSERRRGWAWAVALVQRGHEVTVITQARFKSNIEAFLAKNPIENIDFRYVSVAKPSLLWTLFEESAISQFPQRLDLEIRWLMWQVSAFRVASKIVSEDSFDCVHHVTNTSIRRPSFMGFLGIPFLFGGTLSGGNRTPLRLRKSYPSMGKAIDLSRDLLNYSTGVNPFMHLSFLQAFRIYCDSEQTLELVPRIYRSKAKVFLAVVPPEIAADKTIESTVASNQKAVRIVSSEGETDIKTFNVLFVGRFIFWKGIHLALKSVAAARESGLDITITIVGQGPDESFLQQLSQELEIDGAVRWIPWVEKEKLGAIYTSHDAFLFPSLHETLGNVIIEALSFSLPVVCLDLGGPGKIVNDQCGRVVGTQGLSEEAVVQKLKDALIELASDRSLVKELSARATKRADELDKLLWQNSVDAAYSELV